MKATIEKRFTVDGEEIFGQITAEGVMLSYKAGGVVTRLSQEEHPLLWPVGSDVSAYYEHPRGIVLSRVDAEALGLDINE